MIEPVTKSDLQLESWDQMEERHKRERDAKLKAMVGAAYREGYQRTPLTERSISKIERIHREVAAKYGLRPSDLLDRTNAHRISHPRQEAFSRAKSAGYSTPKIGQYFGGYDHTTVLHGIDAYERRAAQ